MLVLQEVMSELPLCSVLEVATWWLLDLTSPHVSASIQQCSDYHGDSYMACLNRWCRGFQTSCSPYYRRLGGRMVEELRPAAEK